MTKSKGNVVDPLDLMEQYGTDAVRFTLAQLAAQGRDVILSHDRFAASRAFANKIWNAARFVMMNLDGAPQPLPKVEIAKLGLAERWILSRLDDTIREVTRSIDAYEFNVAAMKLYQFIWHEFCDWYIELSKEPLKAGGERQAARAIGAGQRLRQDAAPAASVHAVRLRRDLAGDSSVPRRAESGRASADREISPSPRRRIRFRQRKTPRCITASKRPKRSTRCARCSDGIQASASRAVHQAGDDRNPSLSLSRGNPMR